jgi:hypothetical protein
MYKRLQENSQHLTIINEKISFDFLEEGSAKLWGKIRD